MRNYSLPYSSKTDSLTKPGNMLIVRRPKPSYLFPPPTLSTEACMRSSFAFYVDSTNLNSVLILEQLLPT